jgi:hypothetical protein
MARYKYPVHETVNGITFVSDGPDTDPVGEGPRHEKDKNGRIEDYFLWRQGDAPATHSIYQYSLSGHLVMLLTRLSVADTWEYWIYTGGPNKQTFYRTRDYSTWFGPYPETELRIQLAGEKDISDVEQIRRRSNDEIRIEHQGSACSVVWNQATRQYVRKCQ